MALEIFRLVGSVFVDTDKADKSMKKTDKNAEGVGKKLLNAGKAAGKFAAGVVGAAGAAGAAIIAVAENTREYRTEQGKLQAAFDASGFSADAARDTYEALNGVLGDSGQAVEAANHLAKLATNEEDLAKWTNICTGVYATFGDSIPIEGLTEAANETAKTGALTGSLADALNWAGVNEEKFSKKLEKCRTEQERQALITETLSGLYDEAADSYREINGEVIAANEAQDKLNQTMANIGAAIEPVITWGKLLLVEFLDKLTPVIAFISDVGIPWLMDKFSQLSGWVQGLIGKLGESGIAFDSVMAWIRNAFSEAMNIIQAIWTSVGQPVWNFIKLAVDLVADLFRKNMPAIKEFVRQTFTDIQRIWENNLKPALTAIGNFISNTLAPAFKYVFEKVITPVVQVAFGGIKDLWNNSLKPILTGIIDFVKNVFSGNFSGAFKNLVQVIKGIWEGLKTVVKAPINAVIRIINGFIGGVNKIKIPDWVPGIGGASLNIAKIPELEEGAVLERGQVGYLEGNGAEAVVPLHQNKKWTKAVAEDMDSAMGGSSSQVAALLRDILEILEAMADAGTGLDQSALIRALVALLAKPMDKKLGQLQAAKARA
jgi:hypothetical protein